MNVLSLLWERLRRFLFTRIIGYEAPSKGIKIVVCKKSDPIIIATKLLKIVSYPFQCIIMEKFLEVGYGTKPKNKGQYNSNEVREFDRMWLSDDMPKFSETITISLLHHYLRKVHPEPYKLCR